MSRLHQVASYVLCERDLLRSRVTTLEQALSSFTSVEAAALAAIERVKALHVRRQSPYLAHPTCHGCSKPWPCPTIRALEQQ